MGWSVIAELIGFVGQPTIVRLMPGLRPARTRILPFLFLSVEGGFDDVRDVLSGR
jgi:hypothetical protein